MTTKCFSHGTITIEYDEYLVSINDSYNSFMFTMDSSMRKYFIPYIERLSKICELFKKEHIPTHRYPDTNGGCAVICSVISNCYRGNNRFYGNYMDMERKDEIISAFRKCFKRIKEEDIELPDIDLKNLDIKSLLFIKKGLL